MAEEDSQVNHSLIAIGKDTSKLFGTIAVNQKENSSYILNCFQEGWEIEAYKKIGRDLVKVVRKEDEHLRIVRLAGKVNANTALLDAHFNNFI